MHFSQTLLTVALSDIHFKMSVPFRVNQDYSYLVHALPLSYDLPHCDIAMPPLLDHKKIGIGYLLGM